MEYHKLLNRQINKYLDAETIQDPKISLFLKAVSDSYEYYDRDNELLNHAFYESEKEYNLVNENLKVEYELKQQSIANIFNSLKILDSEYNPTEKDKNDLLYISNYLTTLIENRNVTENSLKKTFKLLKTLLANIQSGILVENEHHKILFTNDLFCKMFQIPFEAEAMIGFDCQESAEQSKHLFKDPENFKTRIFEITDKKQIVTNELIETADGRFLERDYIPIFINDLYNGHLWKYTDVTDRVSTLNLLEQSETRNRLIMNDSLNAIITIDTKGIITFWNKRAETIFGWASEEALGQTLSKTIITDIHIDGHNKGLSRFIETGTSTILNKLLELPAKDKNGRVFPIEISISRINQNGEIFFCSFIQDISERKEVENKLKFQEQKYRNIIANMNLGLMEVNHKEEIQFVNQSFLDMAGYESGELIGKIASEIFVFGDNLEKMNEKKAIRENGVSDIYQIPIKNKRGELRWWAIGGAPNFDDKGNFVGSIGIHLDITEQKLLESQLEAEKIKALEASKAKEVFLANMSHEIRTPLNAIIGFLREMNKQSLSKNQQNYIENCTTASKHLLSIINNVLDISKIEAGEMTMEHKNFDIELSVNNVITILKSKAEQKNLYLNARFDVDFHKIVKGDPLRLEQIFFNLMGNALKFTKKGGVDIHFSVINATNFSQYVKISISDTGIGIDKEYLNTVFKKFSQEDKTTARKFGGTGLGMAITKELIQLMNGTIEVESEKNVGTTITILLNLEIGVLEKEQNIESNPEEIFLRNLKILLVEDNDLNRMVAQNVLQYHNCTVVEAENGFEAIDCLKKEQFDIILMDIQMPEMDGIEATIYIREELKLTTPIIALTANAFKSEIEKCKQAGMDDYLTKPFEEIALLNAIANFSKHIDTTKPKEVSYDLTTLINISKGNNQFVQKLIKIFVTQTTEILEKIDMYLETNNFAEIKKQAHKLKPSVKTLGLNSIAEQLQEMENAESEAEVYEITNIYNQIKPLLKQTINDLEAFELG